jgi:beta-fructofuranosidase
MNAHQPHSILFSASVVLAMSLAAASGEIPEELKTPNYRVTKLEGIGYDPRFGRQDPSNVIKVGDTYHVYTSKFTGNSPYTGVIGHATSTDGIHWQEQGDALTKGPADAWDNYGVLTPYVMAYKDKYYLYYTSSRKLSGEPWAIRGPNNGRHIGLAIADSPNGPWRKIPDPVLSPGKKGEWDSYLVDDAHVIVREGKFWLYYKGGDIKVTADTTGWGLAIADSPLGPFVKRKNNPLLGGHTVCVWPHREGVAALIDNAGPEKFTVQWSTDGIHFKRAAKLEYVNTGCGPYDPDAFTNTKQGRGIAWGVAQDHQQGKMCIVRFDVDLKVPQEEYERAAAAVEAAVPQARKDPTRPVYHFRPPAQWMNDICGAIRYKDCYHVFYQYNPFSGDRWGEDYTLWAHARSKDLVHWEDLPWAFLPMKDRGERRCNSGCITLDGYGRPMIFYTFVPARLDATRLGKREHWGVVPLDDDLVRWRRVKDGPLMAAGMNGVPADTNAGWSDPFVFRSGGRTFVTFKSCNGLVCEAQDKELTQWKYAGRMDGVDGECPNFFALQGKSVLLRSTMPPTYVVGDFDPETIEFDMSGPQGVLDYGFGSNPPKDRAWTRGLYATNVFVDKGGRRIMLGWVCGFKPGRGWNGCMSLPRVLTLDKDQRLVQAPAVELKKLRGRHVRVENLSLSSESRRIEGAQGDTLEIVADFEPGNASAFGLKVRCSEDGRDAATLRYADGTLNVAGTEVPIPLGEERKTIKLHVFLDKSVMEVFINDGLASVTRVNYPGEEDLGVAAFSENGCVTLKSLDVWQMKPIWW